ncbi:MAG: hypothetical protein ACRD2A_23790, partial [Vicinamibacterales bacterium]
MPLIRHKRAQNSLVFTPVDELMAMVDALIGSPGFGVCARSFQQLADVCLRGHFTVPNGTRCGSESELVQLNGATRT